MYGVVLARLGERQLVLRAFPGVLAVLEPVRPGDQRVPAGARGHLLLPIAGQHLATGHRVGPQAGADLDDDSPLVAEHDRVLPSGGQMAGHHLSLLTVLLVSNQSCVARAYRLVCVSAVVPLASPDGPGPRH